MVNATEMKNLTKKLVLKSAFLTKVANRFGRWQVSKGGQVQFGKGAFIGYSSVFEGHNKLGNNSVFVSSMLGYASYIGDRSRFSRTKIGKYCSIGPNVECIFGRHPAHTFVSTHPAFFSINHSIGLSYVTEQKFQEHPEPLDKDGKYSVVIGNDVWIGANVALLDGITVGDGAIIAANALVTKDVPPYTIIGGVPAKELKKRFTEDQITFLLDLKWWEKPKDWICLHAEYFSDIDTLRNFVINE
jgi:acetyltransferase-like isoleucine patch superfamily enzyme